MSEWITTFSMSVVTTLDLNLLSCRYFRNRQRFGLIRESVAGLLEYQGLDDLYRIYAICQRDGTDFNLAYIPQTFTEPERTDFDRVYMRKLYDFGFADAKAGYHWAKEPPMLVGQEATPAKSE